MKREELENKDKELIKKFRTIIRNKKKTENETPPKPFPFGIIFLLTLLIIPGLLFLKEQPNLLFSKEPDTLSPGKPVPVRPQASVTPTEEQKALPDMPEPLPPDQAVADKKTLPESSAPVAGNPVPEPGSPDNFPDQKVQGDMLSEIRIEEIISCSSIKNKQYSGPKFEFSLSQDAGPKIWMKVMSKNPPFTLTHVYYCNGRKYCEVPLAIRYHRMRTWSTVSLRSPGHIGKWRVEVIDETGAKLDQIEFSVVE